MWAMFWSTVCLLTECLSTQLYCFQDNWGHFYKHPTQINCSASDLISWYLRIFDHYHFNLFIRRRGRQEPNFSDLCWNVLEEAEMFAWCRRSRWNTDSETRAISCTTKTLGELMQMSAMTIATIQPWNASNKTYTCSCMAWLYCATFTHMGHACETMIWKQWAFSLPSCIVENSPYKPKLCHQRRRCGRSNRIAVQQIHSQTEIGNT